MGHEAFQYLFETIMGCLLPFTLINTCYSSVLCRLQSARFQRRSQGSCLILMIICAFAVFWLPYHIVNLIQVRHSHVHSEGICGCCFSSLFPCYHITPFTVQTAPHPFL